MAGGESDDAIFVSIAGNVVAKLGVQLQRANISLHLNRQQKSRVALRDAAANRAGRSLQLQLGKYRNVPALLVVDESPFHSGEGIAETRACRLARNRLQDVRNLEG